MTNGFGESGFGPGDYDKLVRQYWNGWGEMMRRAAAAAPVGLQGMPQGLAGMPGTPGFDAGTAAIPGWNEALAWWSKLAQGGNAGSGLDSGLESAIDLFNSQARHWLTLMQQVAAQAQPGANPAEIAQAWQRALGGLGNNPFVDMFRTMRGPGQQGFDSWFDQTAPYLQGFGRWQGDSQPLLGQPTFGFTREHQERWQKLIKAQFDYQQHSQAYNVLMAEAAQNAFRLFETKLTERSEPGRQLETARALFDLWIEAAEEAYAEIALSPRFRQAYGSMVNSQMRLRAGMQREVEEVCELFGMPTRTEVDSAHRKIVQVERELRRIRDALEAVGGLDALAARAGAVVEPARSHEPAQAKPATRKPTAASKKARPGRAGANAKGAAEPAPHTASQPTVTTPSRVSRKMAAKKSPAASGRKPAAANRTVAATRAAPARKAPAAASKIAPATRSPTATKTSSAGKTLAKKTAPARDTPTPRRRTGRKLSGNGSRVAAKQAAARLPSTAWVDRARAASAGAGMAPPPPVLKRPVRSGKRTH